MFQIFMYDMDELQGFFGKPYAYRSIRLYAYIMYNILLVMWSPSSFEKKCLVFLLDPLRKGKKVVMLDIDPSMFINIWILFLVGDFSLKKPIIGVCLATY
jgi:hypothetical protein